MQASVKVSAHSQAFALGGSSGESWNGKADPQKPKAGPKLSVGREIGGLGSNQFTTWSVRGRAAVPL